MTRPPSLPTLSPLEEARFGVRTARVSDLALADVERALAFCREHAVELLVTRSPAEDLATAQALEAHGAGLMDTLVYYARDLGTPFPSPSPGRVRPARAGEESAVERVARGAFRGYLSHYHADPRLERALCDETYADWARRLCSARSAGSEVLVADHEGEPGGFAALRLNGSDEGEGVLYGVAPAARGRGLYLALMQASLAWCAAQGCARMVISTQLTNRVAQTVWVRLGFEPISAHYTHHLWFVPSGPRREVR